MPGELVGVAEIAELLGGLTRQRVDQITRRYLDFPEPVGSLRQGRVWDKPAVEAWIRRHPDRPGGRPKKEAK